MPCVNIPSSPLSIPTSPPLPSAVSRAPTFPQNSIWMPPIHSPPNISSPPPPSSAILAVWPLPSSGNSPPSSSPGGSANHPAFLKISTFQLNPITTTLANRPPPKASMSASSSWCFVSASSSKSKRPSTAKSAKSAKRPTSASNCSKIVTPLHKIEYVQQRLQVLRQVENQLRQKNSEPPLKSALKKKDTTR